MESLKVKYTSVSVFMSARARNRDGDNHNTGLDCFPTSLRSGVVGINREDVGHPGCVRLDARVDGRGVTRWEGRTAFWRAETVQAHKVKGATPFDHKGSSEIAVSLKHEKFTKF